MGGGGVVHKAITNKVFFYKCIKHRNSLNFWSFFGKIFFVFIYQFIEYLYKNVLCYLSVYKCVYGVDKLACVILVNTI